MSDRRDMGLHAAMNTPLPVRLPPTRLGRYHLLERLAMGGMAEVYLATHGELSGFRTLAVVKKVLPHLAQNPQFIAMFLDEARIAALLDHPNVARIFEVGKSGSEYFLAMELVQGKSLLGLQKRSQEMDEPIDPKIGAYIIAQAAAGLQHAHKLSDAGGKSLGLVHRDVSPHNILVSFEGSVKVIDFGVARALGRLSDTGSRSLQGKIGYMSPEQARGEDVDHRTDIWALGVVLWETICGRRLFNEDTEFATMRAVTQGPIRRPSMVDPTIPAALSGIVMRALSRDPRDRFASAGQMAGALERYIVQAGGVSSSELAALMTFLLAEEQMQWNATVRTVLDSPMPELAPEPTPGPTPGPVLVPPSAPIPRAAIHAAPALVRPLPPSAPPPVAVRVAEPFAFSRLAPPLRAKEDRRPMLIGLGAGALLVAAAVTFALQPAARTPPATASAPHVSATASPTPAPVVESRTPEPALPAEVHATTADVVPTLPPRPPAARSGPQRHRARRPPRMDVARDEPKADATDHRPNPF